MSDQKSWPYPVKKFVCHQCGNCCRGDGYVDVSDEDLKNMSAHLNMTEEEFLAEYCLDKKNGKYWNLKDQNDPDQSCIFLTDDNGCRVHEAKPEQCKGFPMRWRSSNILDYCDGWRAMEGLPPSKTRKISD